MARSQKTGCSGLLIIRTNSENGDTSVATLEWNEYKPIRIRARSQLETATGSTRSVPDRQNEIGRQTKFGHNLQSTSGDEFEFDK